MVILAVSITHSAIYLCCRAWNTLSKSPLVSLYGHEPFSGSEKGTFIVTPPKGNKEGKVEKMTNPKNHRSSTMSRPTFVDVFSMEVATPEFASELSRAIGDQKPNYCFQCIKCTSGCTAAWLQPEYRPHQIVNMARLGFRDQLLSSKMIWNCTTCSYCREICPQAVSPVDVVRAVRRIAVRLGQILDEHRKICEFLLETGHLAPINEKYVALRKELGLQPTPPTTHTNQDALREVKEILHTTGFIKLAGGSK